MNYAGTPWYNIQIPKVYWDNIPDFEKIGAKIDRCLKHHFLGKEVVVRVLSSQSHPGKSLGDLIEIIKEIGHDRYDPFRKGDRYENLDDHPIDFFALDFLVETDMTYFENFLEPFYFWPLANNEKPTRIDIAIIYSPNKLERVIHRYEGRENEIKRDGFVFKYPNQKPEALLGIIKVL